MDLCTYKVQVMVYKYNLPKLRDLIQNVSWKHMQVCGEVTFKNTHKSIENFGT